MAFNYPQTSNGSTITIPPEVQYAIGVDGINVKVLPSGSTPNVVYRIGDGTTHPEGFDNVDGNKYLDFYISAGATGATGAQGEDGASAYTQAVDSGYTGTQTEYWQMVDTVNQYIDEVVLVGTDITAITNVNDNMSDINAVADNEADITTVATNISDVQLAATNISDIQDVADEVAKVVTVANDLNEATSEIETVAASITNVDTVGNAINNVNTVAAQDANITAIGTDIIPNITEILQADTNAATATTKAAEASTSATAAASSASSASTSATTATTKASEASTSATNAAASASSASTSATDSANSATASATSATNAGISETNAAQSLSDFNDKYVVSATAPATPVEGGLWFDTVADKMKVYNGSSWELAGSSVNGTSERTTATATEGQTTFNVTYDVGFVDVFVNGIKLFAPQDFTATTGTTVVMTSGLTAGDLVDIIAFGTFNVANTYTQTTTDTLLDTKLDHNNTIYTSGGNVGIGTSSPNAKLDVVSSGLAGELHKTGAIRNQSILKLYDDAGSGSEGLGYALLDVQQTTGTNYSALANFNDKVTIWNSGITFNGDTPTANALDDYEEGTWTPTLSLGVATGHTYEHRDGRYTKVGNLIHCNFSLKITAKDASSATGFKISGVPFSATSGVEAMSAFTLGRTYGITLGGSYTDIKGDISGTVITFFRLSNGSWDAIQNSEVGSTMYLRGSITYRTA